MNYKNINPQELLDLIENNKEFVLVDCRTKEEIEQFALNYHLHLDLTNENVINQIQNLDKNKKYIIYCHSGARSAYLCNYLTQIGFENLYNLDGGITSYIHYLNYNK